MRAVCAEVYPDIDTPPVVVAPDDPMEWLGTIRTALENWSYRRDPVLEISNASRDFDLHLIVMDSFVPDFDAYVDGLRLYTILIPTEHRRKGYASRILSLLQDWAQGQKMVTLVGPVIEDAMHDLLCGRKEFKQRSVLDYYSLPAAFKAKK